MTEGAAPVRGRAVTLFAVGVLLLDGVLLLLPGLWSGSVPVTLAAVGCFLAALLIWRYWLRHRRVLAELAAERAEIKAEVQALRTLVRGKPEP